MEPEKLLAKYPADAIRYWTASAKLGHDIAFSDEQLMIGQKLITKLWNAFKFAEPHLETFSTPHVQPKNIGAVNKWLLHTITICFDKYTNYLNEQEPSLALNTVEQFFWNDYCDNYIELTKNQLFNPQDYPADDVYATKWTLYHVGLSILQMYAPYLPHITETIYQALYQKYEKKLSVHQTRYENIQKTSVFADDAILVNSIITVTSQVRKLKSEKQLSLKTPLAKLYIACAKPEISKAITAHDQLIRGITQAIEVCHVDPSTNTTPEIKEIDGQWHAWTYEN
jgi:valyl-tRNA synthetase